MGTFVFGLILLVLGVCVFLGAVPLPRLPKRRSVGGRRRGRGQFDVQGFDDEEQAPESEPRSKKLPRVVGGITAFFGFVLIVASTAIYVADNQGGVVVKKFGRDLPAGQIIATDGEKGPQAYVLPPGWHFFYWPWLYDLTTVSNEDIPQGKIGVVTAKDGKPLGEGEVFAPAWKSPQEMLDSVKFLAGDGFRGPQLTVLPPAQYRYNPRLFKIDVKPALEVRVGSVAVIKANAGDEYVPAEGESVEEVNGVQIVGNGFRGIWKKPLTPNAYYMHPDAYVVTSVQTTKRVYSYTSSGSMSAKSDRPEEDNSVRVRTKDGYEFPVDVRVSVKISAEDAPYVVAMLADPDGDPDKDGFDVLEERAVLPSLRSIFRNTAEKKGALEYVNSRSEIETEATTQFKSDMEAFRIDVDKVYIADIGLDKTPEGKELLKTQTDKELALQQQETYKEQEKAELQRASMVKAEEQANQEKLKAEAAAKVDIAKSEAEAKKELAIGEAAAYTEKIAAFGSVNEYLKALMVEEFVKVAAQVQLPRTLVIGGGSQGPLDAFIANALDAQGSGEWKPKPFPAAAKAESEAKAPAAAKAKPKAKAPTPAAK